MKCRIVSALVGLLVMVGMTSIAQAAQVPVASTPEVKPQLLLFHGGVFLFNDRSFESLTRPPAVAAGFEPHYVNYPLGDLPAAVAVAEEEARSLAAQFGAENVYAYGSSAGGDFAALLAGRGLVAGAVAKAPPSDLPAWTWPLSRPYGSTYRMDIAANPGLLRRLSPISGADKSPLLIIQGIDDHVVPPAMNERFARRFPRVYIWRVPGGHWTERTRPYLISNAMTWLSALPKENAG